MKCNTKHKVLHTLRNNLNYLHILMDSETSQDIILDNSMKKEQSTTNKSMLQHVKSIAKEYNNIK